MFSVYLSAGSHFVLTHPATLARIVGSFDGSADWVVTSDMTTALPASGVEAGTLLLGMKSGGAGIGVVVLDVGVSFQKNTIFTTSGATAQLIFA